VASGFSRKAVAVAKIFFTKTSELNRKRKSPVLRGDCTT